MDTPTEPDDQQQPAEHAVDRVTGRSRLLPEEQVVGSDDPEAQAAAVLADSDERTDPPDPSSAGTSAGQ